jgi:prepilin-type N-terminal cleavage/methylation domain-containing protein
MALLCRFGGGVCITHGRVPMRTTTRRAIAGFTLVELMVVAIIVAILAAVAIPLMSGNRRRVMATEAETYLGNMRTQLRLLYAETGTYATNRNGDLVDSVWKVPGVNPSDMSGRYWSTNAFSFSTPPTGLGTNYVLQADGSASGCHPDLQNITITLTCNGVFVRTGL